MAVGPRGQRNPTLTRWTSLLALSVTRADLSDSSMFLSQSVCLVGVEVLEVLEVMEVKEVLRVSPLLHHFTLSLSPGPPHGNNQLTGGR